MSEVYPQPSLTSNMDLFANMVSDSKLLTILAKISILDDWEGSEYTVFILLILEINK